MKNSNKENEKSDPSSLKQEENIKDNENLSKIESLEKEILEKDEKINK